MKAGDHIRITRGGVSEHAIEVGDRTVIHFVKGEGVKRSRLDHLTPDGARVEVVIHRHRVFSPKHVVARAFSRFSSSAYSAMFLDSEEFASWCKTGRTPARSVAVSPLAAEAGLVPARPAPRAATPRPEQVRPSPKRAAPRMAAKKSTAKKAAKPAATPARSKRSASKPARPAKSSAPMKRRAPAKQARAGKAIAKASPSREPARPGRSKGKSSKPAKAQKRLASSPPAKPQKRVARPPVVKQKRRKAAASR